MITYLLQVMLYQAIFIVVYELLLKKETFFNYNRVYLLGTSVLALLIPFLKFTMINQLISNTTLVALPEVILKSSNTALFTNQAESSHWLDFNFSIVNFMYVGVVFTFVLFIYRLYNLLITIKKNEIDYLESITIIKLKSSKSAYSFFNFIFLGELISEDEKQTILSHEKVHVREKHSADLIWFELLKIVFWFNPFIYLYQYRIKEVHEYIADEGTMKVNSKTYQNVLLNQLFQSQNLSFVNPFFKKSLIKNRLIMLSKSKSNQKHLTKYLAVLPLICGMLVYSSCVSEQEKENDEIIEVVETKIIEKPEKDVTFNITEVDKIALFPECENLDMDQAKSCFATELSKIVSKNFNLKLSEELGLKGSVRIITKFIINEEGEITEIKVRAPHERLVAEAERVLNLVPKLKPATKDNKPVKINYVLPIKFEIK